MEWTLPAAGGMLVAALGAPLLAAALAEPVEAGAPTVRGSYVEARTADVYTGPCFANSEMNLAGREAVLAWRVDEGGWRGVDLEGLGVVAVVRADATLGDPYAVRPLAARSVLVIDERADDAQRDALVDLARELTGHLLDHVVAVERAPVEISVGTTLEASTLRAAASSRHHGEAHDGAGWVRAGDLAAVRTRGLHDGDHLCGNEEVYYPPLSSVVNAHPGVALQHDWNGPGLGATWRSPGKRSAFVGTFAR